LKPLPDLLPVFTGDPDDDHDIEDIALEVRALAGLDAAAVLGNAIRAAERLGCLVLPFDSELGRHLGMSVRSDDVPVICVVNSKDVPGDRQRFTVAHEVGHLVLHGAAKPPADGPEAARMESQANRFAAAFLGPADPLVDSLAEMGGRVTLNSLTRVKAVWGISIKSLVGRYKALGVIGSDQARSLYKQISARGWNRSEPVEVPSERAQWLGRVLELKAQVEEIGEAARTLASEIGANPTDLFAFASWDIRGAGDVVSLATRRESLARQRQRKRSKI
jgi:Zn-dependent peptidase ImmA (M78 family)